MSATFYDLMRYAKTGIASPEMTHYDKLKALAIGGSKEQTLTGIPPISFKSDGTPLISWTVIGNGQQIGTPSPQNIIMPTFCGVRTGNLFNKSTVHDGYYISDTSGMETSSEQYASEANASDYIPVSGDYVSIFSSVTGKWRWGAFYDSSKTFISGISGYNKTIAIPQNAAYMRLTVVDSILDTLMFNLGQTALPYEPYGYKIPLTCAGQTVPVYLGQVSTVRRVKKIVLDGTEDWALVGSDEIHGLYVSQPPIGNYEAQICSHFVHANSWSELQSTNNSFGISSLSRIVIHDSSFRSSAAFKEYLSTQYTNGTPVTIWYILATPQTGIVNEPLCKISTYADELHSTDAAVTIPTAKGANTLTVDTDLQPSEVSITGKIKAS